MEMLTAIFVRKTWKQATVEIGPFLNALHARRDRKNVHFLNAKMTIIIFFELETVS